MTPVSDSSSYLTPADFLLRKDIRPTKALVKDDGTGATDLSTNLVLNAVLMQASGTVESSAVQGDRYSAADLRALVDSNTNGGEFLKGLVADIACHILTERRWISSAETLQGYVTAMNVLDKLSKGVNVLPFAEVAAASNAVNRDETQADRDHLQLLSSNSRAFGTIGLRRPKP